MFVQLRVLQKKVVQCGDSLRGDSISPQKGEATGISHSEKEVYRQTQVIVGVLRLLQKFRNQNMQL